ncbi:MAG TPA: 2-oxoglutarate dehydrogenase complex dihydrolipoyllysine-residue succinyltransferase [Caulobacteraceae bacterium]|jgi:2-oxoglutarate dehydrogenase E2 component (dihydrolipoamide succinyltransferase)
MTDILTPTLGESVAEATVARWTKKPGDAVKKDEVLVELETDKVSLEVAAPSDGVLSDVSAGEGATVTPGQVLGKVSESGAVASPAPAAVTSQANGGTTVSPAPDGEGAPESAGTPNAQAAPSASRQDGGGKPAPITDLRSPEQTGRPAAEPAAAKAAAAPLSPSAQRIVSEAGIDPQAISGTGKDGRITKGDALAALEQRSQPQPQVQAPPILEPRQLGEREERVKMTRLRQTIARRLKEAQNSAAMLTTFNEVDMSAVMALRSQYKDQFEKRHGVKLGFMGFFVKAVIQALKEVPAVNAEIEGTDIIYKNHYDLGVAVGTEKGLVVPVLRDADQLSLAEVEKAIGELGKKARDGHLALEDLQGGTFTISNGGVYGSLMSTPILNAPQSGVLGMHKIQERPVAVGGQVVVRPMMYLALSYDHRIVDGKEAVTWLVRVKENIEDPERLLLEV